MPAAAVIPAPIAYIKVVAVKKLVVGFQIVACGSPRGAYCLSGSTRQFFVRALNWVRSRIGSFTLKKLECSKQAIRLNNGAWNNGIGPRFYFVGFRNSR